MPAGLAQHSKALWEGEHIDGDHRLLTLSILKRYLTVPVREIISMSLMTRE